ncbi:MAG: hypothetical protein BWY76_02268 [bacterium ADurb.Bin429]|nr:MAG: hypothetical protein BWY76_02268 [bacterium ADurb.Bin429]
MSRISPRRLNCPGCSTSASRAYPAFTSQAARRAGSTLSPTANVRTARRRAFGGSVRCSMASGVTMSTNGSPAASRASTVMRSRTS